MSRMGLTSLTGPQEQDDPVFQKTHVVSVTPGPGSTAGAPAAGATRVFVWGLNDKDQLGGFKGSKIKTPLLAESMAALQPAAIAGGSKSLFVVTQSGKVLPVCPHFPLKKKKRSVTLTSVRDVDSAKEGVPKDELDFPGQTLTTGFHMRYA